MFLWNQFAILIRLVTYYGHIVQENIEIKRQFYQSSVLQIQILVNSSHKTKGNIDSSLVMKPKGILTKEEEGRLRSYVEETLNEEDNPKMFLCEYIFLGRRLG